MPSYGLFGDETRARAVRVDIQGEVVYLTFVSGTMMEDIGELVRKYGLIETTRVVLTTARGLESQEVYTPEKAKARLAQWKSYQTKHGFTFFGHGEGK